MKPASPHSNRTVLVSHWSLAMAGGETSRLARSSGGSQLFRFVDSLWQVATGHCFECNLSNLKVTSFKMHYLYATVIKSVYINTKK